MICAQALPAAADGTQTIAATATQPADMATCSVVLITGSELSAVTGIAFPSPVDFAQAWGLGFTLVVGCFLIGWSCGAVLRMIR